MATALEKLKFDKIENVHDDGTSTKLSEHTATSKESDATVENGEETRCSHWNVGTKVLSKESRKCK